MKMRGKRLLNVHLFIFVCSSDRLLYHKLPAIFTFLRAYFQFFMLLYGHVLYICPTEALSEVYSDAENVTLMNRNIFFNVR